LRGEATTVPARILIVEDEAIIAMSLRDSLERFGYEVAGLAGSGEEALSMAAETGPDLILMDIMIRGGMDGIKTARELRQRFDIPFIYVSAFADRETVERARDTEPYGYLNKPVSDRDLYSNIDAALLRHRLERKLRESEEQMRIITENMRDTVWLMDLDFATRWISPSVTRTRGYTLEELASLPLEKHLTPDSLGAATRLIAEYLTPENLADRNREINVSVELEYYRKDGSTFWADTSMTLLRDAAGRPAGFLGVGRDITERRRAEEQREEALKALRESEERFRLLVENINDVLFTQDETGIITYISPVIERISRYKAGEIVGRSFTRFVEAEDLPALMESYSRTIAGGTEPLEFRLRDRDGTIHHVRTSSRIIEKNGAFAGLTGILTDITDRKKAESQREAALEALEESRRSLLTLMGNLPGIAYRCRNDPRRTMELVSEGCLELTGYAPEDLTLNRTLSFNDLIHPEDREFVREETDSHVKRKVPYQIAYRITTARGDVRWVWEKGSGVFGKTGDLVALEGFITDITDRKAAEENIRLSNDKLLKTLSGIIQSMEMTLEVRDPYTAGHQRRVAHLARAIASEMGLSENEVEGIHIASTIHDLGKIQVPIEILSKPTRLTELEFNMIKNHSRVGFEILKNIDFPWPVAEIVHQHHERLDGTGYPRGLKGDDVILEARILMVADIVEAVASHRPYRPALGTEAALEEIRKGCGFQLDVRAVDACLRLFLEKGFELE
jgi:PAS domain S-box-containing protein/putative nucleotidyltransferase with HDIG domain